MPSPRQFTLQPVDPMTGRPLAPPTRRQAFHPYNLSDPIDPIEEPQKAEKVDDDPYPTEGTIPDVLGWVDRAPEQRLRSDRAKAAIVAELGRGTPRTTLLPQLEERTGSA
jgi:hypothetical protein